MALSINELNAVSHEYFDQTILQEVYDEIPFLAILKSKNKVTTDGGSQIQFPIRYKALGTFQAVSPRQQIEFSSEETRTAGVVDWAYLEAHTMLHWDEKVKNSGKGQIIDLAKDKAAELKDEFYEGFSTQLWATSTRSTNELERLATIVDSSSTYAGIAVADDSNWASAEDSSTTTLTIRALQTARNNATFGKNGPSYHFTTKELVSKYESILLPHMRFESTDMKKAMDLGFQALSFYGAPVIFDTHIPDNAWYGLDMDKFELRMHPDYAMQVSDWEPLTQAGFIHATAKFMSATCQLVCKLRKTSFKFTALNAAL